MTNRVRVIVAVAICLTASASWAEAQGNGRGNAYGKRNQGASGGAAAGAAAASAPSGSSPTTETAQGPPAGVGVRNFGAWLDDASVMAPGSGSLTLSVAYWRTPAYREVDVPVVDGGLGLSRRVQFGFSVPYYHANEPGGPIAHGLGDLYFTTKIQLREPSSTHERLGFSVTPLLEVLSVAPGPDRSRVNWALPANVEWQGDGWRTYGSAGYFSRGAVFGSGALEVALSDSAWFTGSISQSVLPRARRAQHGARPGATADRRERRRGTLAVAQPRHLRGRGPDDIQAGRQQRHVLLYDRRGGVLRRASAGHAAKVDRKQVTRGGLGEAGLSLWVTSFRPTSDFGCAQPDLSSSFVQLVRVFPSQLKEFLGSLPAARSMLWADGSAGKMQLPVSRYRHNQANGQDEVPMANSCASSRSRCRARFDRGGVVVDGR